MNRFAKLAAAVLIAALIAVPSFAGRGSANFSKFVALGDSYGAGVVSASLNERHQVWSWPAVLARQFGFPPCDMRSPLGSNCFSQPLVSFPGIGPELVLVNLAPTIAPASNQNGAPFLLNHPFPYNNLAVPGATVGALLQLTGAEPVTAQSPTPVIFGQFILRGLGTQIQQAVAQRPTFIAVWIGGNDFLGSVLAGTDQNMTSAADFRTRYEAMLDQLIAGAPNAGMVVGNLPTANSAPIIATIPPFIVNPTTRQPILGPNGQPIFYIADLGGGNIGQLPPGSAVLLTAQSRLATGFGFPNIPPFNALPNAGKPLPASDVLTPTELANITTRIGELNTIIQTAASARNIPVANIRGLFDRITVGGVPIGPITVTSAYIQGGFFSLDGFHATDLGYLLFANEYIKAVNASYDTEIPLAGISQLFSNNGAFFPETADGQLVFDVDEFVMSSEAAKQIITMWAQPAIKRFRSVGHH